MSKIKISVIICTYNRAGLLPALLNSLAQQTLDSTQREILLVDNASTDSTHELAEEFIPKIPGLRYIFEPKLGLSSARNRGWKEACGEYVAYVDDDCRTPADWLFKALTIVADRSPLAFGGPFLPFYLTPKPEWYKDAYGTFQEGKYAAIAGPANDFNLCGGNFIVQRQVLKELGGFNPQLGMTGNTIAYAEEDELQSRIRQHWPQGLIYFDPQLIIHHLVAERKMRLSWRIHQQFQRGRSLAILFNTRESSKGWLQVGMKSLKTILLIILSLLRGLFHRDTYQFPYYFQWIYEDTALYVAHLGALVERGSHGSVNHV